MTPELAPLFTPYPLNSMLTLKNRILMAPMTRNLAHDDLSPTEDMVKYYERRSDAGLIITEGTIIRPDSIGFSNVPGIYTPKHIEGWKKVTDAVHAKQGRIFLQIWHVGRVSHPHFLEGKLPLGPSETTMTGRLHRSENLIHGKNRAATIDEIKSIIASFADAAHNAMAAGFDGVEIHGANGYLIDQFLHYQTNFRSDEYGGNPENMARFALEVVKACGKAIGFDRVGLRLSPGAYLNEIVGEPKDAAVFQYVLEQLNPLHIAYVHTGNFNDKATFAELNHQTMTEFMRGHYQGTLVGCGSYSFSEAAAQINAKHFDLVAIGRPFIANPDLIKHLQTGQELKVYDAKTMLATLN